MQSQVLGSGAAHLSSAVDVDRAVTEKREVHRILQVAQRRAGEHEARVRLERARIFEAETDATAIHINRIAQQARRGVEGGGGGGVEREGRPLQPDIRTDAHDRAGSAGRRGAQHLRRGVAAKTKERSVAAARGPIAKKQRLRLAAAGLLNLRALANGDAAIGYENDVAARERCAGVVHSHAVRLHRNLRPCQVGLTHTSNEQALRVKRTEIRGPQCQRSRAAGDSRPGDENVHRAADVHKSAACAGRCSGRERACE